MAKGSVIWCQRHHPVLWLFMFLRNLARLTGCLSHSSAGREARVKRAMRFYQLFHFVIVPLMMAMTTLNTSNDREFAPTLGRLCFLLLCAALFYHYQQPAVREFRSILTATVAAATMRCQQRNVVAALLAPVVAGDCRSAPAISRLHRHRCSAVRNLGRHLVYAAGGLQHYHPLDADPAPPYRL